MPAPDAAPMTIDPGHGALMDRVYRRQRHVYDLTRKFYLLGRDDLVRDLNAPPGGSVLEIGCGTGRNLIAAARAYPTARCHGIDISRHMLDTAAGAVARAGLGHRVALALGDATRPDPLASFGRARFDRVFFSYSLSMIPDWAEALDQAFGLLAPGGEVHIVDFGAQGGLPVWFRAGLRAWLALFHVAPRDGLETILQDLGRRRGAVPVIRQRYRGYAVQAVVRAAG